MLVDSADKSALAKKSKSCILVEAGGKKAKAEGVREQRSGLTCRMQLVHGLGLLVPLLVQGILLAGGVLAAALQAVAQSRAHVQRHDRVVHARGRLVPAALQALRDGLGDGVRVKPRHLVGLLLLLPLPVLPVVLLGRHRQEEPAQRKDNVDYSVLRDLHRGCRAGPGAGLA